MTPEERKLLDSFFETTQYDEEVDWREADLPEPSDEGDELDD